MSKSELLVITVKREEKAKLQEWSHRSGLSMGAIVRLALAHYENAAFSGLPMSAEKQPDNGGETMKAQAEA